MKSNRSVLGSKAAAGIALVLACCSAIAHTPAAQPGPATQRQTASGPPNPLSGLNLGPLMMSFGGASGIMTDFTRSNARILLQRTDVRSDLFLDSKQRDELAELDQQSSQQLQQKMAQTVIQNVVNNPDFKLIAQESNGGKLDPAALTDVLNTSFQAMQKSLQAFEATLDSKDEALLNANQIKRLHELDLQWRGLLSLSDKSVADELKLTPEQSAVAEAALKDYHTAQTDLLTPIMTQMVAAGEQTARNGSAPRSLDRQTIPRELSAAMDSDTMRKARTSAERKIQASLTADQLASWKKMIGVKFQFVRLDQ